jgi:transcription-repair coupling factor (superfamily II helicase)
MILGRERLMDGLARIEAEALQTVSHLKKEGRVQEAHRLRTSIDALGEQVRELEDYGALESYIHYFYPRTENLLDLFSPDRTMIFLDEPHRIGEHTRAVELEFMKMVSPSWMRSAA